VVIQNAQQVNVGITGVDAKGARVNADDRLRIVNTSAELAAQSWEGHVDHGRVKNWWMPPL
jgi:hypothetical protein